MRLVAYSDCTYKQSDGDTYGEIAFAQFLAALAPRVDKLTVVGRVDPEPGVSHYRLPAGVRFLAVPHYATLTMRVRVLVSLLRSLRLFWRALDDADAVWVMGPYLHGAALAVLAKVRGRRVVLGVRQDFPSYVRRRRPNERWTHVAADLLELIWRALSRSCPVITVGDELASRFGHAPSVLPISVSLITERDIQAGERAVERSYEGDLSVLSVSRLDYEKNPLLLADTLAALRKMDPRWRMIVCGDGPLEQPLMERLIQFGLADHVDLRGYVALNDGLLELYRSSHAFLHVSHTEGVPQVLLEAFASGVPVVATAVGGVAAAAGDGALLIPPSDPDAAAASLQQIGSDLSLRSRLVQVGFELARRHTLDRESARVAAFIAEA